MKLYIGANIGARQRSFGITDLKISLWRLWGRIFILDPFDGAKPCLSRRRRKTPLRVNPCLPAGRLSPSTGLRALSLSKGKSQHLCRGVEGLTLPIFHESFPLTPGFIAENEEYPRRHCDWTIPIL
jgi:hypothetical protein